MVIGDWRMRIGPIPNPKSTIHNPQIINTLYIILIILNNLNYLKYLLN